MKKKRFNIPVWWEEGAVLLAGILFVVAILIIYDMVYSPPTLTPSVVLGKEYIPERTVKESIETINPSTGEATVTQKERVIAEQYLFALRVNDKQLWVHTSAEIYSQIATGTPITLHCSFPKSPESFLPPICQGYTILPEFFTP